MITFTGTTALEYWMWLSRTRSKRPTLISKKAYLPDVAPSPVCALFESEHFRNSGKIELLIRSHSLSRGTCNVHCIVRGKEFPKGSFIRISRGVQVVSPQLLFLEFANRFELPELVQLGNRLTSKFVYSSDGKQFYEAVPITNAYAIKVFLQYMDGYPGIKTARRAVKYLFDKAESPMEIKCTCLLILPRALGGYGLPIPKLGYEIEVDREMFPNYPRSSVRFDMFWKNGRLDVEYDSDRHHSGTEKLRMDSLRRNIIRYLGYYMITVTSVEYFDIDAMTKIATNVAKLIGYRLPHLDIEWRQRSLVLRDSFQKSEKLGCQTEYFESNNFM